jgi:hypothetical protein
MSVSEYSFSNFKVIFLLETLPVAISANPGCLFIGKFKHLQYTKFLKIKLFDVYNFFLNLVNALHFFTDDTKNSTENEIIFQTSDTVIFWTGKTLVENGSNIKIVSIGEESSGIISQHFFFNISQSQNFLITLKKAIMATFCFQSEDYIFVNFILKKNEKDILKYVNFKDALQCVQEFNSITNFTDVNKIDFLQYYLEVFLILQKLTNLILDENPRKHILMQLTQS